MTLETLTKLTASLPTLDGLHLQKSPKFIQYEVISGTAIGFFLWNELKMAAQRVFLSAGTEFVQHFHEELEYVLVYSGEFEHKETGNIYQRGESVKFKALEPHSGKVRVDTWILSVTIPASKDYMDGR